MICTKDIKSVRFYRVCLVFFVLLVRFNCAEVSDFVSFIYHENGEVETLIRHHGISAKEISVVNKNQSGLSLRQISNGKRFIQLIFDEESLKDCKYIRQKDQIQTFLDSFKPDHFYNLTSTSKVIINNLNVDKKLPHDVKTWFSFKKMQKLCHKKHHEVKNELEKLEKNQNLETNLEEIEDEKLFGRSSRNRRSFQVLLPGTNWCGDRDNAKSYTDLNLFWETDKCCRKHDFCQKDIPGFSFRYSYYNFRPFTISHCKCDDRSRRDLSDFFRVPGTQWCGKGYSAKKYTDVGMFSQTDRCCRKHDLACPFWIGAFQTKYGVHNNMINTLMHCSCDERFRACLKRVGTVDANLVGNIFFNFVQRECFTLEPKKICDKKYQNHEKRNNGQFRKKKDLNSRRSKRNEKKCRRKNTSRKAIIRRNLVY